MLLPPTTRQVETAQDLSPRVCVWQDTSVPDGSRVELVQTLRPRVCVSCMRQQLLAAVWI